MMNGDIFDFMENKEKEWKEREDGLVDFSA